jgi:signal transduction histidine kinase
MSAVDDELDTKRSALLGFFWPPQVSDYVGLLIRLITVALVAALSTTADAVGLTTAESFRSWWFVLLAMSLFFSWAQFALSQDRARWVPVVESVVVFAIVASLPNAAWPLAVYVIMAPVLVGTVSGIRLALAVSIGQVLAIVVLQAAEVQPWYTLSPQILAQFALIGLIFGLSAAAVRHAADSLLRRSGGYNYALALLERLTEVTRALPAGLSMEAVAAQVRSEFIDLLRAEDVTVFVQGVEGNWSMRGGDPAASAVVETLGFGDDWSGPGLHEVEGLVRERTNPWTESNHVRALPLRDEGRHRSVAVVRFAGRPSGVTLNRGHLNNAANDAGAQLAAAEVYAEVRERATNEERLRVSREIHDGVAQDLAALTYRLDNLARESGLEPVDEAADEVRRLVRELRLSIFDLRTDLSASEALSTAIGTYAQQISSSTGIVVHTTVSEHGPALDPHTQHELLRVCQEAVANARRHARARNMWITYKNFGAGWVLRVSDDGVGTTSDRAPARGLAGEGVSIMRERVSRMGARLSVRRRIGGGTVVEVTFDREGAAWRPDRSQVSPWAEQGMLTAADPVG